MTQPTLPQNASKDVICGVNPVVKSVKKLGRSRLFLCVCLFQTFAFLASLCYNGFMAWLQWGSTESIGDFFISMATETGFSFVIHGLLTLGFWLVRRGCNSNDSPFTPTGGLTFFKGLVTVSLVVFYLVALACPVGFVGIVFALMFGSNGGEGYLDDFSNPAFQGNWFAEDEGWGIMLLVVCVVVFFTAVFQIVAFHCYRRGLKTMKENFGGILSDRSFPMFGIVSLFLTALSFLGGFNSFSPVYLLGWAQQLLWSATVILLAVWLIGYREEMKRLRLAAPCSAPQTTPQPTVLVCETCGAPRKQEDCFCGSCGTPFQNSQQNPVSLNGNCVK